MIDPNEVEILIPSIRPETLWGCLMSLSHQSTQVRRVIVRDNSIRGATSNPEVRFAIDAAATVGLEVLISRGTDSRAIPESREALVVKAGTRYVLFSDDDCYWAPGAVEALFRHTIGKRCNWIAPLLLTPNNEAGLPDWIAPWDIGAHEQFTYQYTEGSHGTRNANGGCLLFERERYDPHWLAGWPEGVGWEDRMIVRRLGYGTIVHSAHVWHMIAPGGSNPMRRSDDKTAEFVYRTMEDR